MGDGPIDSKKYRAAIIGLGKAAWGFDEACHVPGCPLSHAGAYRQHPRVRIVGGYSPDGAERDDFSQAYGVPSFESLEQLLDGATPDVVSICSPSDLHAGHLRACVEAGIPMVWLEKPPATTLADLDPLLRAVEDNSCATKVLVNYQRRYVDGYLKLKQAYEDGQRGQCKQVNVMYSRGLLPNGSHIIDSLFFVLGDPSTWSIAWKGGHKETPSFVLQFSNGLEASVVGADLPYHCLDMSLIFDEGRLSVIHGGMTFVEEHKEAHELFPGFHRLKLRDTGGYDPGLTHGMTNALNDLLASYENGCEPLSNLRTSLQTQAVIEAVAETV